MPALPPFFDPRRVRELDVRSRRPGWLAGMRVRKKLVVLHTVFSLVLAGVLLLTLRPAVTAVVREAEVEKSVLLLELASKDPRFVETGRLAAALTPSDAAIRVTSGDAQVLRLESADIAMALARDGRAVPVLSSSLGPGALIAAGTALDEAGQPYSRFIVMSAQVPDARRAVSRLYVFVVAALMGIYLLVALALELFVLPANVYGPVQRMLEADDALQGGHKHAEIIPESLIPRDELGEIMRSRNRSITQLRAQETQLARALATIEDVATDLKRKNHLLEAAKRNLQDADRLAGLGMMSAGVAHELNTPLAVIKGLTERLISHPEKRLDPADAALMLRVVQRLERLGESLLDYARVRTPRTQVVEVRPLVQEALTLVKLDRELGALRLLNDVPPGLEALCDPDRMIQVFVNLIRNAGDALREAPERGVGVIEILAQSVQREGRAWITIRVQDNGPGIDPKVLPRLLEPFVSTRLDSKGTGLGLAVADGIVREHGGLLLAHNRGDGVSGAVFEVMLPADAAVPAHGQHGQKADDVGTSRTLAGLQEPMNTGNSAGREG